MTAAWRGWVWAAALVATATSGHSWDDKPTAASPERAPHTILSHGGLEAWVALPFGENRFYGGARFETTGAVAFLQMDGMSFVGWGAPLNGGLTLGLSGEFLDPLPTGSGNLVVKLGVGVLELTGKRSVKMVRPFPWTATLKEDFAEFVQEGSEGEIAFRLTKALSVENGRLRICYDLKNTGTRDWKTRHYGHNFLVPGGRAVHTGLVVKFPVDLSQSVVSKKLNLGADFNGRQLVFRPPAVIDDASLRIDFSGDGLPRSIILENRYARARVTLETSWAPHFYRLYGTWRDICPEPFFDISLEPGEAIQWSSEYHFELVPGVSDE